MALRDQDRELIEGVPTDAERATIRRQLGFPEEFPEKFWTSFLDRIAVEGLQIPASQIPGLRQFRPKIVMGDITGYVPGTSYGDMGLENLRVHAGEYLVWFGWGILSNNSSPLIEIYMQPRGNDETLVDSNALRTVRGIDGGTGPDGKARTSFKSYFRVLDLPNDNNTIRLAARVDSAGATWTITRVWMMVIKIGN